MIIHNRKTYISYIIIIIITIIIKMQMIINLHFHSLDLDPPVVRGLVQHGLHGPGYALSVAQDLVQILGSQDVSQRSLC